MTLLLTDITLSVTSTVLVNSASSSLAGRTPCPEAMLFPPPYQTCGAFNAALSPALKPLEVGQEGFLLSTYLF
jgi:hypothetical protein